MSRTLSATSLARKGEPVGTAVAIIAVVIVVLGVVIVVIAVLLVVCLVA